jgi:hypothetical protein
MLNVVHTLLTSVDNLFPKLSYPQSKTSLSYQKNKVNSILNQSYPQYLQNTQFNYPHGLYLCKTCI